MAKSNGLDLEFEISVFIDSFKAELKPSDGGPWDRRPWTLEGLKTIATIQSSRHAPPLYYYPPVPDSTAMLALLVSVNSRYSFNIRVSRSTPFLHPNFVTPFSPRLLRRCESWEEESSMKRDKLVSFCHRGQLFSNKESMCQQQLFFEKIESSFLVC